MTQAEADLDSRHRRPRAVAPMAFITRLVAALPPHRADGLAGSGSPSTSTQYQLVAPTATTDRVCAAISDCAAGQVVMYALARIANRELDEPRSGAPVATQPFTTDSIEHFFEGFSIYPGGRLNPRCPGSVPRLVAQERL